MDTFSQYLSTISPEEVGVPTNLGAVGGILAYGVGCVIA